MIVRNLYILRASIGPPKHNPPPIVDADRVLASKGPFQRFQPVSRRRLQSGQDTGGIHHDQLTPRGVRNVRRKSFRELPSRQDHFGPFPFEGLDGHAANVSRDDTLSSASYRTAILGPRRVRLTMD